MFFANSWFVLQDPRNQLNFCISGLVQVECTEALYNDNPEKQNSVEIGELAVNNISSNQIKGVIIFRVQAKSCD